MRILSELFCLLLVLNLVPCLTRNSLAANGDNKPIQGHIEKKGKLKSNKLSPAQKSNIKANNPYSISKPYNPSNPPPINNKIHPVSSNAR